MPTPTYVALAKTVLTGTQATITFSSIPSTYTDLVLLINARTNRAAALDYLNVTFNASTTNYSSTDLTAYSTTAASNRYTAASQIANNTAIDAANNTTNTFGSLEIYIPNYAGSTNKIASITATGEDNSTGFNWQISNIAGLLSNTAAVSSITINRDYGTAFVSGSRFDLYGIKNS